MVATAGVRRSLLPREHYESLVRTCGHKGDVNRAEALMQLMLADGHKLDAEMYNMVINACMQSNNIKRGEWHLECMRNNGFMPDSVTYNVLLNGLAAVGDLEGIKAYLNEMSGNGVWPNSVTFGTMCKAYACVGDVASIELIIGKLDKGGEPLNEYFFASLIKACGIANPPRMRRAEKAFQDLVQRGLRPQRVKSALLRTVGHRRAACLWKGFQDGGRPSFPLGQDSQFYRPQAGTPADEGADSPTMTRMAGPADTELCGAVAAERGGAGAVQWHGWATKPRQDLCPASTKFSGVSRPPGLAMPLAVPELGSAPRAGSLMYVPGAVLRKAIMIEF